GWLGRPDSAEEGSRGKKGKCVQEQRRWRAQDLDEDAAETRAGDVRKGAAPVQQRGRLDVVLPFRDGDVERHVGDVEYDRERSRQERNRVELPERERVERIGDRNAGEKAAPRDIGGDHEPASPFHALQPGSCRKREEQVRDEGRCGQVAHLGRVGVQNEHRGERQRDERDLVAEERHGLAEPEIPEVRPPEEPHTAGSTVSGFSVCPSPSATATRCPAKCSATEPCSLPGMERPWRIARISSSLRARSGSDMRAASGARTVFSSASWTPNEPTAVRLIVRQCPPRWSAIARMYVPLETFRSSSTSGGSYRTTRRSWIVDRRMGISTATPR